MTPDPVVIARDTLVSAAKALMSSRHVRHLPVLDHGDIVGLLNDHDIRTAGELQDETVEAIMMRDLLIVPPDAPVAEVAQDMFARGRRCVLIATGTTLLGIFTSGDALALVGAGREGDEEPHAPTSDRWGHILRE